MKYLIATIITTVMLLGAAQAADFQKGLDAAESGDYVTALREWKPLAEQGSAKAQFRLGLMYYNGHGVRKNDAEAVRWHRKAADQGHTDAQMELSLYLEKGAEGVPKNPVKAAEWGSKSRKGAQTARASAAAQSDDTRILNSILEDAKHGDPARQAMLGYYYEFGDLGLIQDYVIAHMWYNIASAGGNEDATRYRSDIERKLSRPAIEEAQRRARVCMKSKYKNCD